MKLAAAILAFAAATAPIADPALEARAQALDREIRCVACENEPISQSAADIAGDMRRLVRERIAAGDSDDEVRAFFASRYGEFVLLRPRAGPLTWPLWMAPALLLAFGALVALSRRRATAPSDDVEPADER